MSQSGRLDGGRRCTKKGVAIEGKVALLNQHRNTTFRGNFGPLRLTGHSVSGVVVRAVPFQTPNLPMTGWFLRTGPRSRRTRTKQKVRHQTVCSTPSSRVRFRVRKQILTPSPTKPDTENQNNSSHIIIMRKTRNVLQEEEDPPDQPFVSTTSSHCPQEPLPAHPWWWTLLAWVLSIPITAYGVAAKETPSLLYDHKSPLALASTISLERRLHCLTGLYTTAGLVATEKSPTKQTPMFPTGARGSTTGGGIATTMILGSLVLLARRRGLTTMTTMPSTRIVPLVLLPVAQAFSPSVVVRRRTTIAGSGTAPVVAATATTISSTTTKKAAANILLATPPTSFDDGVRPYQITTPIYYVNDKPHIGHAYTSVGTLPTWRDRT